MTTHTKVSGEFEKITRAMMLYFRSWESDLEHQGEKGGVRERRVKDLLSAYLPKRYAIGTGHIIDSKQNMSYQSDIVIYDAIDGIALPIDNYYSLFPCECVYATVEVKSKLTFGNANKEKDRGEIYKCAKATDKLKELYKIDDLPPIVSLVFAYTLVRKTQNWQSVAKSFYRFGQMYNFAIPEMVIVLDDPAFVLCSYKLDVHEKTDRYSHLIQKNPLLFFISDLIKRLARVKVSTPDLWEYYGNWTNTDVIATIIPAGIYPEIKKRP